MPRTARFQPKSLSSRSLKLTAELLFSEDGKFVGWKLLAGNNKKAKAVIDALMNGKVPGLEYCQDKLIRPIAGGAGEYHIALVSKEFYRISYVIPPR